ncbi:MAG: hypothetical protein DSZ25_03460 [Thermovibrio sp.]|nr:MAG: hypothetical protein DSZ25_03460 [Thermovibrio sp.]
MKWEKQGGKLKVKLLGDFNYERVLKLKKLSENCSFLEIDLSLSRFADTEAVDFLYNLKLKGIKYELLNRPELLNRVCEILGVEV